jgi:hypothetical protein
MNKLLITAYVVTGVCITALMIMTGSIELMWFLAALAGVLALSAYLEHKATITRNKNI